MKEQPGSSTVVQGVASDKFAIGYSGIGYRTADVRPVPICREGRGHLLRHLAGLGLLRQLSDCAVPLHLRQQEPQSASRSASRRIREVCDLQGRSKRDDQGWLLSDHERSSRRGPENSRSRWRQILNITVMAASAAITPDFLSGCSGVRWRLKLLRRAGKE